MAIPGKLAAKIEVFLAQRSQSQGGYAPVGENDLEQLAEILQELVNTKYQADPDGDRPISFQLVDRTRYHMAHFSPIPHLHGQEVDLDAVAGAMRSASYNLSVAQGQVEQAMRQFEMRIAEPMRKGLPVSVGDKTYAMGMPQSDHGHVMAMVEGHTRAHLAKDPPIGVDDFQIKQTWTQRATEAVSKAVGAPCQVQVYRGRQDEANKLRVVVSLDFLPENGQASNRVALAIDDPRPAWEAGEQNKTMETRTAKARGPGSTKQRL